MNTSKKILASTIGSKIKNGNSSNGVLYGYIYRFILGLFLRKVYLKETTKSELRPTDINIFQHVNHNKLERKLWTSEKILRNVPDT